MSTHLVIDGYNLIRRSPSLSMLDKQALQKGREELIRRLAFYKKAKPFPITVVFDGWNQPDLWGSRTFEQGIRVVFSRMGQKADDVIIQMAGEMREKAMVVTSDREVQTAAERHHATVVSSEDFEQRMEMAFHMNQKGMEAEDTGEKETATGTRKKGPAKRLPKSVRKAQRRIKRL
jgi:predicted RNA-binding protein with PIN domain